MQLEKIWENIPKGPREVFDDFLGKGYIFTIVGGNVRDFLIDGTLGKDIDIEVTTNLDVTPEKWVLMLNDLKASIEKVSDYIDELDYHIFRAGVGDFSLELTPLREEKFIEGRTDHSNFDIEIHSKGNIEELWKRRDFSVNAIGLKVACDEKKTLELVDPFKGQEALNAKKLVPCSENFWRDPVRLLRALRFRLKLGFEFDDELTNQFKKMDLNQLSFFYFLNESFKVNFKKFCVDCDELISSLNIPVPLFFPDIKKIYDNLNSKYDHKDIYEVLVDLFASDSKIAYEWGERCQIKRNMLRRFDSLQNGLENIELSVQKKNSFKEYLLENKNYYKDIDALLSMREEVEDYSGLLNKKKYEKYKGLIKHYSDRESYRLKASELRESGELENDSFGLIDLALIDYED